MLALVGLDVNRQDSKGNTALHFAMAYQKSSFVEMLRAYGADPFIKNHQGVTALELSFYCWEVVEGDEDVCSSKNSKDDDALLLFADSGGTFMVNTLLQRGVDVEYVGRDGLRALDLAARGGHADIVRALVANGANINFVVESLKQTTLMLATIAGRVEAVCVLLQYGADPNLVDGNGNTALHFAALHGTADVIGVLIEYRADVNAPCHRYSQTPLMVASIAGHVEAVNRLLLGGGSVLDRDQNGNTALHMAACRGFVGVVDMLIRYNADINSLNNVQRTPFVLASIGGKVDVVKHLLQNGADPRIPDQIGNTALHYAVIRSHLEILHILIQCGVNINFPNQGSSQTPLMIASITGNVEFVEILLQLGADPNVVDGQQNTALTLATIAGHIRVQRLLEQYGAEHDYQDVFGLLEI